MLVGVEEDRVSQVGGKAAILEEIIRRCPDANAPSFNIFEGNNVIINPSEGRRVVRASSDLDLFGGCGLHNTYIGVSYNENPALDRAIRIPDSISQERIRFFAESIGRGPKPPVWISQVMGNPMYWVIVLEHPNRPNNFLINYSITPSNETYINAHLQLPGKLTRSAILGSDMTLRGEVDVSDTTAFYLAVKKYLNLRDSGIVHKDWTSIFEGGLYPDYRMETYQFTPIRRRLEIPVSDVSNLLVFGASDEVELPVVLVPDFVRADNFKKGRDGLEDFPDFRDYGNAWLRNPSVRNVPDVFPTELMFWLYMQNIDKRFPEGYIVITDLFQKQEFDIPMKNARVVLINSSSRPPVDSLNHSISRLIYKVPVLVVGELTEMARTGDRVKFSCDGSTYKLR